MRIEENTFLVAGGGSGLGEATVRMLVASGARVVVADLKGETPEGGRFVETDVTDPEQYEQYKAAAFDASRTALVATASMLRGDLDTIVLKALQKDPGRRYQSALQRDPDIVIAHARTVKAMKA